MTEKRERGRPSQGLRIQKHIFLDQETADKLAALARSRGESESSLIRRLILREVQRL